MYETTTTIEKAEPAVTRTWISCNACGADAYSEVSQADGYHIGYCRQCSLTYVNPMPFFAPSEMFSEISTALMYTRLQYEMRPEMLEFEKEQVSRQMEIASRLAGRELQPGRFLDVGCGSGWAVKAAADLGWDAAGVDIDPVLTELGRKELSVDLLCGTLRDCHLAAGQYRFIRIRDVFEHLPNPYEVLQECRRLLAPGGIVMIATPNEAALINRVRYHAGIERDKVATMPPPHHLHGFSPKTVQLVLKRAGLKVYEVKTTTPVDPLYVTAKNMWSLKNKARVVVWKTASAIGRGNMLVAWAGKSGYSSTTHAANAAEAGR